MFQILFFRKTQWTNQFVHTDKNFMLCKIHPDKNPVENQIPKKVRSLLGYFVFHKLSKARDNSASKTKPRLQDSWKLK